MIAGRLAVFALMIATCLAVASAAPPRMLWQAKAVKDAGAAGGDRTNFAIMRMPDGSFAFYDRNNPQAGPLTLPDRDGKSFTLLPALAEDIANSQTVIASGVLANTQVILTPEHEVVSVFVKGERLDQADGCKSWPAAVSGCLDQASRVSARAVEPKMIWRGYNGSQMEYQQLPEGRILVPYGSFQPHAKAVPPPAGTRRSSNIPTTAGDVEESESKLIAPCYAGFNGSNEGACEPAIEATGGRTNLDADAHAGRIPLRVVFR